MEEGRLVNAQPLHYDVHDRSCGHKSRIRESHDASLLQHALVQPPIHKSESLAAVVNLLVLEAGGRTALHDGDVLASTVSDARHVFSEMDRGIGIVAYAQQEHVATKLVEATNGAVGTMRRRQWVRRDDALGQRPHCRERVGAVAAEDAGEPSEGVGRHAHAGVWRASWVKGVVVVVRHTGHDQRPAVA